MELDPTRTLVERESECKYFQSFCNIRRPAAVKQARKIIDNTERKEKR